MKTPARKGIPLQYFNRLVWIGFLVALPLSGCSTYGSADAPKADLPQNWLYQSGIDAKPVLGQWWAEFDDPALNQLIARALAQAPDRRLALARINEARALARGRKSNLMPVIDGTASVSHGDNTSSNNIDTNFAAGFDASWEIDLFGKNMQQVYAANANREAVIADEKDVTLSLVAEIARQYTLYKLYQQQATLAENTAQAQQGILQVTEARYKQGVEGNLELSRARALQETTRAQVPLFRDQAQTAAYQIDYLVGDAPGKNAEVLNGRKDVPMLNRDVLLNVPANVIQNRPDIKAAEERVIAATSLKRSAIAEMYPTVSVSALLGLSSGAAGNLFESGSRDWSVGGGILAPLFHFGRIRADIDASKAREEQAVIQFEQTVLAALRDIETASQSYQKAKERQATLTKALEASKNALTIARKQYGEGILSQLDVLEAEQNAFSTEEDTTRATSDLTVSFIALCKALALQPQATTP